MQKKQSKNMKRKTRQGKALEKKATRSFMDVLQEANLESLPPHVPTYLKAAVGPPSTSSRRHYCSVCGSSANYTCVRCGTRFCSCRCQVIHNDTRCLKFVAWPIKSVVPAELCKRNCGTYGPNFLLKGLWQPVLLSEGNACCTYCVGGKEKKANNVWTN